MTLIRAFRARLEFDALTLRRGLTRFILVAFVAGWPGMYARPSLAQETHIERLQQLAVMCLGTVVDNLNHIRVDPPANAPYVKTALLNYWMEAGKTVFVGTSTPADKAFPSIEYVIDRVGIDLEKMNHDRVMRRAYMGIRYTLKGPASQILADSRCDDASSDTLSTAAAHRLRDDRYPETDVQLVSVSWFKRIVQPVVVLGAAAVGTFLFFNLRSGRSNGS